MGGKKWESFANGQRRSRDERRNYTGVAWRNTVSAQPICAHHRIGYGRSSVNTVKNVDFFT